MRGYFQFVIRHRIPALVIIALISGAGVWSLQNGKISSSLGKLFLADSPAYDHYLSRVEEFGSDEQLIIAFEEEDVLGADSLRRLLLATEAIREAAGVARVMSLLDNEIVFAESAKGGIEARIEELSGSREKTETARAALLGDRFTGGILLSEDSRHGAVLITTLADGTNDMEDSISWAEGIHAVFLRQGYREENLHRAGGIAIVSEMMKQTHFNLERLFPVVCLLLILTVYVLFRKLWPALVSTSIAIVAVIWTMGIAVWLDPEVSIMLAAIPAVILIISFSDVIHLCSAYLLELEKTSDKTEAILRSAEDVGKACIYTSITTFVGFLALAVVPTPIFRKLGILLGLGVGIALLLAMTLFPILLSFLRPENTSRSGIASVSQDLLDRFLSLTQRISLSAPWLIIVFFAGLLGVSIFGISKITVENDIALRLGENNPVRRDTAYFTEHFAGTNVLDLYLQSEKDGGLLEPKAFEAIVELEKKLVNELTEVDSAASFATILTEFYRRLPGNKDLPVNRFTINLGIREFERRDPEGLAFLLNASRQRMRVFVRLNVAGLRETHRAGEKVARLAVEHLEGLPLKAKPTGMAYLIGGWLDRIILAQTKGVGISFIVISLLMIIAFRSLRAGLWSMIPNVLPLLVLGGYVGLAWEFTDSDTFMIAMLAIGMGVDDTIHFLTRYRLELARHADVTTALSNTYHYAGRGIVMTTLILTIGFSPFIFCQYFSLRILGTLLPLVLIVALLADLLLLPALARLRLLRF